MQIDHLLVDEIYIDQASLSGMARATIYSFQYSRWVSPHKERNGERVGPMTLVDSVSWDMAGITKTDFGERKLHSTGSIGHPTISYRDRWTIPTISIYAFVLPTEYVATQINIDTYNDEYRPTLIGVTQEGNLFYHTVFADFGNPSRKHIFDVTAQLEHNPKACKKLADDLEAVKGTKRFEELAHAAGRQVRSVDFWFKLLDLGTKFFKTG